MRIAVVNWSRRRVGGVEEYVNDIVPAFVQAGHVVMFWHETDQPVDRARIELPDCVSAVCAAERGVAAAVAELRAWRPDVIYVHGLLDPDVERQILGIAPSVFFVHAYHGTCVSGGKTFKRPVVRPCSRVFGWPCLVHYFPHGCGGRSPFAMVREYRRQSDRLALLRCYDAIVTHTGHMCEELARHGLVARGVIYPVRQPNRVEHALSREAWRLLFAGRMDLLKGGHVFLNALSRVKERLDRPVWVTFAGDGPKRAQWERMAAHIQSRTDGVRITFVGWVERPRLESLLTETDLLVVPSLWPEPFGSVGPLAGLCGVPAAAFSVGGIPEWLIDGVNGHLAPGAPASATGLADAIVRCLADAAAHAALRRGAREIAGRFNMEAHLAALVAVFERMGSSSVGPALSHS